MESSAGTRGSATKARVLDSAMRMFGEQGYAATSVAQIEEASGMRPGSGGIYRHFSSKRDVLEQGVRRVLDARSEVIDALNVDDEAASLRERLRAVADAGLARLEHDVDLNRIMIRDLRDFPDLASEVRRREVDRIASAVAQWLRIELPGHSDPEALAVVLMSAVSHFWTMRDSLGAAPLGLDRDRFLDALTSLVEHASGGAGVLGEPTTDIRSR